VEITDRQPSQSVTAVLSDGRKAGPQHKQSGINKAERELGLARMEAHRATKIAELSAEAKEAARDAGLDDIPTLPFLGLLTPRLVPAR
jgi:hypothetical protein